MDIQTIEQTLADKLFLAHGHVLTGSRVDGADLGIRVELHQAYSNTWRPTGRAYKRIIIGELMQHINTSVYKMSKKTGQFNWDKIVNRIHERLEGETRRLAAITVKRKLDQSNHEVAEKLNAQLTGERWGPFQVVYPNRTRALRASRSTAGRLKMNDSLSQEQASALANFMETSDLF